jgi:hypothetical protein
MYVSHRNHHPLYSPPLISPPWWSLKATIHIDIDKETAEAHHLCTNNQVYSEAALFYTDGSGINDGIGAPVYCHSDQTIQQSYLGGSSESMVYPGELEAILIAVTHATDLTQIKTRIFSDSQAAMRSLAKPRCQSGQAIIERILNVIDTIFLSIPHIPCNSNGYLAM